MAGNVYRFDPPPQWGTKNATLPAQVFSNPPLQGPLVLAALVTIVSAWPQANEPRLQQRDLSYTNRSYVAPLTLTYGQQPPIMNAVTPQKLVITQQWPALWYPAQSEFANAGWNVTPYIPDNPPPKVGYQTHIGQQWQPLAIIPLGAVAVPEITPGDNPPLVSLWANAEGAVIRTWWPETNEPRLPQLLSSSQDAAVESIQRVDNPPQMPPLTVQEAAIVRTWWAETNEPRLPQVIPPQSRFIAPLTLIYGQAPPQRSPEYYKWAVISLWQPPWGPWPVLLQLAAVIPPPPPLVAPPKGGHRFPNFFGSLGSI